MAGSAYALTMFAMRLASRTGVLSADAARFDAAALLLIAFAAAVAVLRLSADGELLPATRRAMLSGLSARAAAPPLATATTSIPTAPRTEAAAASDAPDALDARLADALEHLMTRERVYRVDDLTLGVLALKLGVPEYRLRRFIHQRLGHRNFNAYVNGLRLAEARAALADPARRGASVLEIAMEAGFASIGPFNRAFKATSGVTPSEFRRGALADS